MDMQLIYAIKALILPPASPLILVIFGIIISQKNRIFGLLLVTFSSAILFILCLPIVANQLAESQEKYSALEHSQLVAINAQAIIILGGGTRPNAYEYENRVTVNIGVLERLRYAARISRLTKLPILVSGGRVFDWLETSEAAAMVEVMQKDFKTAVAFQEDQSRNTAENAEYSFALLAKEQINRIILVTQAMHMRRAVEQFERVGFKVTPAPTYFITNSEPIRLLDFFPSSQALDMSQMALHEWLGRWWYRFRYF
jgi:uncharacterized SAM-binding protein YcdF (DUF218 family)